MAKKSSFTPSEKQAYLTSPCLAVAKKSFTLTEDEAEQMFLELMDRFQSVKRDSPDADYRVKFEEIIRDESARAKQIAQAKRISARLNPLKARGIKSALLIDGTDADNISHRFFAYLVGATGRAKRFFGEKKGTLAGLGDSVGTLQDKRYLDIMARIISDTGLSEKAFRKAFRLPLILKDRNGNPTAAALKRTLLVKDVIVEMFGPNGEGFDLTRPKSYTGNKLAFEMAQSLVKAKHHLVKELQKQGVPIGWLSNHVTSQYHDPNKIREFSGKTSEKWVAEIFPLLNHERTFSADMTEADKRRMLATIYDNIVTGKRTTLDATGDAGRSGTGKKSIGNLISQSRVLHFKDPDAWMKYNELFGHDDPFNAILQGIKNISDDLVLIEKFGTNPDDAFARIKRDLQSTADENYSERNIDAAWKQLTGEAHKVEWGKGSLTIHRTQQVLSQLMNMSSLGATIFPSISDVPYAVGGLRKNGMGFFDSMSQQMSFQMRALRNQLSDAEINEVVRMVSVGMDGMMGTLHSRNGGEDAGWGFLSRLQERFYDLNLLSGWTDSARTGFGMALSNHVGTSLKKSWDQIDPGLRKTLEEYNIDSGSWMIMRDIGSKTVDGNQYFTPDLIKDFRENIEILQLKDFEPEIGKEVEIGDRKLFIDKERFDELKAFRERRLDLQNPEVLRQLEDRIGQYFYAEARNAILETGKGERALMFGNSQPGTIEYAMKAMFFTFKGFPIAYLRRVMPRYLEEGARYWGPQVIALTATGYIGLSLRALSMGQQPPDPRDPKTSMRAFLYSGAGSMVSDLVANDFRKYGRGLPDVLLGPAYSKIAKPSAEVFAAVVNGDFEDALDRGFQASYRMVPFNNHFAFRAALEGTVLNSAKEWLNPGSLRQKERRLRSEGVEFLPGFSPTELNLTR